MRYAFLLPALLVATTPLDAQQAPRALTADDYARAEKFLAATTTPLVSGANVRPTWLSDGRFWYRNTIAEGNEFVLADPVKRTRSRAFDHVKLAAALSAAAGATYEAFRLPFTQFELVHEGQAIQFQVERRGFRCDVDGQRCLAEPMQRADADGGNVSLSPDGKRAAFIRDFNLWVRDIATGKETQLTTDGVKDFGYATNNAGWTKSDNPVLLWSPDSRKIATFQHDGRNVGMMYLVNTAVGHPTLQAWKYPLPGDSAIFTIQRVILDVDAQRVVRFQMPSDAHRSTLCDHVFCRGSWADVEWYPDGTQLAFVSSTRDHKEARLRIADAQTGAVREILEETVATQFESGSGRVNWHVLPASNEVIWFSERDDWGHLYLYDLRTGQLKNRITSGVGTVLQLLRIDEKNRLLYFTAAGREAGRDPYFRHFYRIGFDGKRLALLTPEDADHEVTLSPDGRWFVDSYSRPDVPPVAVLRDAEGKLLMTLEKADISRLVATGWTPPIPFSVKARDGVTDLYGLMYRPTNFDSTRTYPIINNIYPGPQSGSVGSRGFSPARGDTRAIAELGFIVIQLDAMGTPTRSKSFHDAYYSNMGDNGLPDHITGMRQLAARHRWIDLERAGIYGHSGGGFASADAILRYPDFFKVAVSQAGNHDNRNYEDDWGERYQGLLTRGQGGTTNYDNQANQLLAQNLKGKLLLAHGTLDSNVPPYNTLVLVNELIRHNKDFDLIMMPNRGHGFGAEAYMMRRRWDYFVKHLLGAEPPKEYEIGRLNVPRTQVP
jgi:dipeptidyl aminopeptidase/acylaminoacyl peptidase